MKAGGKGTQGGSGTLAYRPGWHLGEIPYALQFNRRNPQTGERDLFPADFVWAEVEYAADHDYQQEAMSPWYQSVWEVPTLFGGAPPYSEGRFLPIPHQPESADRPVDYYRSHEGEAHTFQSGSR